MLVFMQQAAKTKYSILPFSAEKETT